MPKLNVKLTETQRLSMLKWRKPLLFLMGFIIAFTILIILFISPISKYVIEKYDEEYTGRQITMDWVYVNPFTGNLHFKNFKIYEFKSDSVFLAAPGLNINIGILQIFSKQYIIKSITLTEPLAYISQNNRGDLNFADLIKRFSSKNKSDTIKKAVYFNILNMKIDKGEFHYREKSIPFKYFVKDMIFESEGMKWDVDTLNAKFSFKSGLGSGNVKGEFTLNLKTLNYSINTIVNQFDLKFLEQYLKDISNFGNFSGKFDADVKAKGNLRDAENIVGIGSLILNDVHLGKTIDNDYAAFDKLTISINEINPKNRKYLFDSLVLVHPFIKYERYDYLDNFQLMFGKKGENIKQAKQDPTKFNLILEIANYVKLVTKNFFRSYYQVNKLAVYNADINYNDFTLNEQFSIGVHPLNIQADTIDKNNARVKIYIKSGIEPYGNAALNLSINPKDSSDFDIQYNFQKIPITIFNPYTIAYTSFPLDRGTVEFNGKWHVINGNIDSDNHIVVIDPRVSKRIRKKDMKWAPLPLIMAFVRERGNVIDYQIPIKGSLKDPNFHLRDVLFDLIKNIFVKPVTIPYGIAVKNVENDIEKLLTLKWEINKSKPLSDEEKFIEKMANFLKNTPDASITIKPQSYALKEKEYILFYEAKKKYYLDVNNKNAKTFTEDDSLAVDKLSVKDSSFVRYLNNKTKGMMLFTVQDKCKKIIDSDKVLNRYNQLIKERANVLLSYFKAKEVENRVKIVESKNVVPFNGYSFYEIIYNGEYPKPLLAAYRKLEHFDNQAPRKKFKDERRKIPNIFNIFRKKN